MEIIIKITDPKSIAKAKMYGEDGLQTFALPRVGLLASEVLIKEDAPLTPQHED